MEQLNQILYEHRRNQEWILYMRQWIESKNQNKIDKELIKTVKNIQMSLANHNINTINGIKKWNNTPSKEQNGK